MLDETNQSFLGRGWSFPPSFNWEQKSVRMSEEEQDIKESLFLLMSTLTGERTMRPDYGCDLHGVIFSPRNAKTQHKVINIISNAISTHEPRIIIETIEVQIPDETALEGWMNIVIEYTIIAVNKRTNIVYPFYLLEGSLVDKV